MCVPFPSHAAPAIPPPSRPFPPPACLRVCYLFAYLFEIIFKAPPTLAQAAQVPSCRSAGCHGGGDMCLQSAAVS